MKVVQIIWNLAYGDGVSNCALSISKMLDEFNYSNIIIANNIDERIQNENIIKKDIYESIPTEEDDIIIYHFSIGCSLNYIVEKLPLKKILVYQNVTDPDFFRGVDDETLKTCLWGKYDASKTSGRYLKSIAMSEFSKNDLIKVGWKEKDIFVMPLIAANDISKRKNQEIIDKYNDDFANILFVGRIAPNKKIEDIIKVFSYYQKNVNSKSRLFLIGSKAYQNYYIALCKYAQRLKVDNVIFSGHVTNEDLEAYYAVSDIFLCMSEHEGFCIPLVEAMKREIPIIAYSSTAVPDTLGDSGILVNAKDDQKVSENLNRLFKDEKYRKKIINSQNKRLEFLIFENYKSKLNEIIEEVRKTKNCVYSLTPRDISVSYPMQTEVDKNSFRQCLYEEQIVLYGIGKVGKELLDELERYNNSLMDRIIICDNTFQGKYYNKVLVLKHAECVVKYSNALYIITVQNAFVEIIADLISSNIKKENIRFYNFMSKQIV